MKSAGGIRGGTCPQLETDLVLYHYGELGDDERRKVAAHVKNCTGCGHYLQELADLLPKTLLADEPSPSFWNDYSRELRGKIFELGQSGPWWRRFYIRLQPWALPVLATSAVVALALTFTLEKGSWQNRDARPPVDEAFLEFMPMAENLEFFRNLDVLDSLEVLEQMGESGNDAA